MARDRRLADARAHVEASVAMVRALDDPEASDNLGAALGELGRLRLREGRLDEALAALDEAEPLLGGAAARYELGLLLCARARLALALAEPCEARALLARANELSRAAGFGDRSELALEVRELRKAP